MTGPKRTPPNAVELPQAGEAPRSTQHLLWITASASNFGDGIRTAALPLLTVTITRNPIAISGVAAAAWLPWLLFGLVSGAIVDRVHRIRLLRNVQIARFALVSVFTILVLGRLVSLPIVYLAALAVGTGEIFADIALQSLTPEIVPNARLEKQNAWLSAAETLSNQFIGPSLGGVLFLAGRALPFGIDAASFLASAGLAERLRRLLPGHKPAPPTQHGIVADTLEGVRYLARHRVLRTMALWVSSINLSVNAAEAVLVLYAVTVLHIGAAGYGLLLGAAGVGGLVGALISSYVVARLQRGRTMLASCLLAGVMTVLLVMTTSGYVVGIIQFFIGLSGVSFTIVGRSVRQALSPPELIGRVTSSYRLLGYGAIPLGSLVGGVLCSAFGIRAPFIIGGLVVLTVSSAMTPWILRGGVDRHLPAVHRPRLSAGDASAGGGEVGEQGHAV